MVSNFRAKDVALGGQGAPLVSLGEAYLFSGYDVLLNLGGIANVSIVTAGGDGAAANQRGASGCVAFDVCPCNMLLNCLAQRLPGSAGALVDASRPDTLKSASLGPATRRNYYVVPCAKTSLPSCCSAVLPGSWMSLTHILKLRYCVCACDAA